MATTTVTAYAAAHSSHASMSLKHECDVTVEELESALLYDLKPHAADYILAYRNTGVCPVFLAAKDALESGWGRYPINGTNISGFYGGVRFTSVSHGIDYVSQFLDNEYLTPGGKYFCGYTLSAVNRHYNGSLVWEQKVNGIMQGIDGRVEKYRAEREPDEYFDVRLEDKGVVRWVTFDGSTTVEKAVA